MDNGLSSNTGEIPAAVEQTTREYGSGGFRASVAAAQNRRAIAGTLTLGNTREVRVRASVACWLKFGDLNVAAAVPAADAAADSIPIEANQPEVIRVPLSATHFSVIRDSADGYVTLTPVA